LARCSGDKVQRCALARELDGDVQLLIVANPCFGPDVRAVAETRARIMAARNAGTAVLLISGGPRRDPRTRRPDRRHA
jgi:simple sugar transport system ATP-binding protein